MKEKTRPAVNLNVLLALMGILLISLVFTQAWTLKMLGQLGELTIENQEQIKALKSTTRNPDLRLQR